MSVAGWEYWTVANMLVSTHGDGAEMKARLSLEEARQAGRTSDVIVWSNVLEKLAEIRTRTSDGGDAV